MKTDEVQTHLTLKCFKSVAEMLGKNSLRIVAKQPNVRGTRGLSLSVCVIRPVQALCCTQENTAYMTTLCALVAV